MGQTIVPKWKQQRNKIQLDLLNSTNYWLVRFVNGQIERRFNIIFGVSVPLSSKYFFKMFNEYLFVYLMSLLLYWIGYTRCVNSVLTLSIHTYLNGTANVKRMHFVYKQQRWAQMQTWNERWAGKMTLNMLCSLFACRFVFFITRNPIKSNCHAFCLNFTFFSFSISIKID